jgi:serine/threonine protein phosphatase PrpC
MNRDGHEASDIELDAAGATEVGKRRHNEDVVLVRKDLGLFLVADGAGGHNAGDVASALAARSIGNYLGATVRARQEEPEFDDFGLARDARHLARAIRKANRDIFEISRSHPEHRGMGTTVVAAFFSPRSGIMHVAHVGDSRCYRMREGNLELLTQDHSLLTDVLEERPELDDTLLTNLPRHAVTRALGMQENVRVAVRSYPVTDNDRFLLCSDGLSVPVSAAALADTLDLDKPPGAIVQHLLNLANEAAGRDNIAVLVVDCAGGPETTIPLDPRTRATKPQAPARPAEPSEPELLLLGIEEVDLAGSRPLQVVPPNSASDGLAEALAEFARTKPSK